ncbi:hypothetical protein R6Q59_023549 [Mikania micrantha]
MRPLQGVTGFYRHDLVRDVLCDVLKRANISIKKEASVNFLTDSLKGRSTLRHACILVFGWEGGKHPCVTGVSPLVGLRDTGYVAGHATLKARGVRQAFHSQTLVMKVGDAMVGGGGWWLVAAFAVSDNVGGGWLWLPVVDGDRWWQWLADAGVGGWWWIR